MENQLLVVANQAGIAQEKSAALLKDFAGYFEQAKQIANTAKDILVNDESQVELMKQARKERLALREIRVNVENTRKDLKEESLREGKAIDGIANVIKALIVPVEEHLEKQEKFAELAEQSRKDRAYAERVEKLSKFVTDVTLYALREMSDESFVSLLSDAQKAHEAKAAAEKKAEDERLAEIAKKEAEQEAIRVENEKLKRERDEREKTLAIEKAKQDEALEKERKAQQAKIDEQRRIAEAAELKLKQERELKERQELEEKRRAEDQKRLEEEEERKKLLAPDKEKLNELASAIESIKLPAVSSKEAMAVIRASEDMIGKMTTYIREKAKTL